MASKRVTGRPSRPGTLIGTLVSTSRSTQKRMSSLRYARAARLYTAGAAAGHDPDGAPASACIAISLSLSLSLLSLSNSFLFMEKRGPKTGIQRKGKRQSHEWDLDPLHWTVQEISRRSGWAFIGLREWAKQIVWLGCSGSGVLVKINKLRGKSEQNFVLNRENQSKPMTISKTKSNC